MKKTMGRNEEKRGGRVKTEQKEGGGVFQRGF